MPKQAVLEDWCIRTGYNPWDLENDPTLRAIKDQLYREGCQQPGDIGCQALIELAAWESENEAQGRSRLVVVGDRIANLVACATSN